MPDNRLNLDVKMTARLEHRHATSDCCGALLMPCPYRVEGCDFHCRQCGQSCGRSLSEPTVIEASNG